VRRTSIGILSTALGTVAVCAGAGVAAGPAVAASDQTPIVVGGDGDLATSTGVAQGFQAGIYRFNKSGGLDGRKIKFLGFLDDGLNPATNLTNAQKLVEAQHVLAVVPVMSQVAGAATGTFLAQSKVPFIGWSVNAAFATQPKWGFGINGDQGNPDVQSLNGMTQLESVAHASADPSKVKIAFIAENVPVGIASNNALAAVAKHVGFNVVYAKGPIAVVGTTDYAPYAQAIISSGANAVYEVLASADAIGLSAALKQAGFKGTIVNGVTYYPGELSSQPSEAAALNSVYVENEFPTDENATPAVKQAQADLKAIGQPPYLTSPVSVGYWSAILFEQMLRATLKAVGGNPAKVTSQSLEKTVVDGFTYKDPIAGGIGTEHFPAAGTVPTGCGTLVQTTGTTFKEISPYQCAGSINTTTGRTVNQATGKNS
jgi:ABC-type branched-subunit amino acid transport system substrate-binding protein